MLDATSAAVPNANVTATNVETSIAHSTVSGKNGDYVLTSLPPGSYTLTVEAPGFSKLQQTGIVLQVNQQARVDLSLKVGQTAETVSVEGHPPLLESESSSVGTVINQKLVNGVAAQRTQLRPVGHAQPRGERRRGIDLGNNYGRRPAGRSPGRFGDLL